MPLLHLLQLGLDLADGHRVQLPHDLVDDALDGLDHLLDRHQRVAHFAIVVPHALAHQVLQPAVQRPKPGAGQRSLEVGRRAPGQVAERRAVQPVPGAPGYAPGAAGQAVEHGAPEVLGQAGLLPAILPL